MKPGTFIEVAAADLAEPTCFVVPEYMAVPPPDRLAARLRERPELKKLYAHPLGVRRLTGVTVTVVRDGELSPAAAWLSRQESVKLARGRLPAAEFIFDRGAKGKSVDLRPDLPMVVKY
jgi:hypothetical protein